MNEEDPGSPRRRDVRRRFDRAAANFDDADFVHRVSGDGLLERLEPLTVEAKRVVDLGAATGSLSLELARRFRGSRVLAVDQSLPMLGRARRRHTRFSRVREINAEAEALPLPAGSVDVVVANMLLPFIAEPGAVLGEVARVLRRDGVFAFASLGPDSLGELREAFAGDGLAHVMPFADMHDVGDALVRAGLRDPVLDVDRLTVSFADPGWSTGTPSAARRAAQPANSSYRSRRWGAGGASREPPAGCQRSVLKVGAKVRPGEGFSGRTRQGCRVRAYRDVFTASPKSPPRAAPSPTTAGNRERPARNSRWAPKPTRAICNNNSRSGLFLIC